MTRLPRVTIPPTRLAGRWIAISAVLAATILSGLGGAGKGVIQPARAASSCGVERWAVKTGTDADAGKVSLGHPAVTSIAYLTSQPTPGSLPANARISPVETTEWILDATLTEDKYETDSDYHLVLSDSARRTMIAEIPDPGCVGAASPFLAGIQHARSQFDLAYHAGGSFSMVNVPVRITGVGFFDYQHGQTGVAPNAVELHPVMDITFHPSGSLSSGQSNAPNPPPAIVATAVPSSGGAAALPTVTNAPSVALTPTTTAGTAGGGPKPGGTGTAASEGGAGMVLVLLGFLVLLVGIWALIRGHIRPIRINSRKRGAAVLSAGFVLILVGAVLTPTPPNTQSSTSKASPRPSASPSPSEEASAVAPLLSPSPSVVATAVPTVVVTTPAPQTAAPTHSQPPPPPPAGTCTASMSNPTPGRGGSETVHVSSNVPNTGLTVTVHYKSKDSQYPGTTNGAGVADVTFGIGSPTAGYKVVVDVDISGKAQCQTSFTPH